MFVCKVLVCCSLLLYLFLIKRTICTLCFIYYKASETAVGNVRMICGQWCSYGELEWWSRFDCGYVTRSELEAAYQLLRCYGTGDSRW